MIVCVVSGFTLAEDALAEDTRAELNDNKPSSSLNEEANEEPNEELANVKKNETLQETGQSANQDSGPLVSQEKKVVHFLSSQVNNVNRKNDTVRAPASASDALNVSLGLIFILLLVFLLAWFMKKMGYSHLSGQGQLSIVATLNLGQKEKIALIQVGNQQLLVGVTQTQINTLYVLDEALEVMETQSETGSRLFADKLTEFMKVSKPKKQ